MPIMQIQYSPVLSGQMFNSELVHRFTRGYPLTYKISPYKLMQARRESLSYLQLKIDFGKEFDVSEVAYMNRFDLMPEVITCVLCHKERELRDRLPFEYDGMDIILSPYSEVYGDVCFECFDKHNGLEINKLSERREIIQGEIQKSRTIWEDRIVLFEKVGHLKN